MVFSFCQHGDHISLGKHEQEVVTVAFPEPFIYLYYVLKLGGVLGGTILLLGENFY